MLRLVALVSSCSRCSAACADTRRRGHRRPQQHRAAATTCTFTGDPSQPFLAHGEIYVRLADRLPVHAADREPDHRDRGRSDRLSARSCSTGANVDLDVRDDHASDGGDVTTDARRSPDRRAVHVAVRRRRCRPTAARANVGFELIPAPIAARDRGAVERDRRRSVDAEVARDGRRVRRRSAATRSTPSRSVTRSRSATTASSTTSAPCPA